MYALLVGTKYVRSCGGDSVSHRLLGMGGKYKYGLGFNGGNLDSFQKESHFNTLASCPCPTCGALREMSLFNKSSWTESHTIWYAEKEKDLICENVQSYLDGHLTLKQLCTHWLGSAKYELLSKAVNYLNSVIAKGYHDPITSKSNTGLFEKHSRLTLSGKAKDHYLRTIQNYEKFHKKKFL